MSSADDVKKLLDQYDHEIKDLKSSALSMAWHMRGGASYEDILNMSDSERKEINKLIENNLEITKKSQLPYF